MATCSVCAKPVEAALGFLHRCGHSTHAMCIEDEDNVDFKHCARCNGQVTAAIAAVPFKEPRPTDGIDYVKHPGKRYTGVGVALTKVTSLLSRGPPADLNTTQDATLLLNNRVPIADIMRRNKIGLWHMLRDGITIDDFARNSYTWEDLAQFEDIGQAVPRRVAETLVTGLRVNANHLRDYPRLLPVKELQERAEIGPAQICTHLGLAFPPDASLECQGDANWTAKDCVALGFSLDDLSDIGLAYTQQYEDLLFGLTRPQIDHVERALGVTPQKLAQLVDIEEVIRQTAEEERRRTEEYQRQMIRATHTPSPQPPPPRVEKEADVVVDLTPVRRKPRGPGPKSYIQRSQERYGRVGFVFK